jgi:hypothetical protein
MIAYKLFRVRKDGSLGPLFINRRQRIPVGRVLRAESHPTKGYAYRPGWHCCGTPSAPHLKLSPDRRWFRVWIDRYSEHLRPESQGGRWYTARKMLVIAPVE